MHVCVCASRRAEGVHACVHVCMCVWGGGGGGGAQKHFALLINIQ